MKPNWIDLEHHPELREIPFHSVDREGKAAYIPEDYYFWVDVLGFSVGGFSDGFFEEAQKLIQTRKEF